MNMKIISIIVLMLFISTAVLPVVNPVDNDIKKSSISDRTLPLSFFLSLFNGDWDYWTSPPDMYALAEGNVGIGTYNPYSTLHVSSDNSGGTEIALQSTSTGGKIYKIISSASSGYGNGKLIFHDFTLGIPRMTIDNDGDVGIGTYNPISKLHVNGNIYCSGKITAQGGVDPPYVSFSKESHESIREYAKNVEKHEEVLQFWNGESHRMEVYVISEDAFYTINGELIE